MFLVRSAQLRAPAMSRVVCRRRNVETETVGDIPRGGVTVTARA